MATIRRVVAGHNSIGKSVVSSDEQIAGTEVPGLAGFEILDIWGSNKTHQYPDDGTKPAYSAFFAPVGGYRFMICVIPPDPEIGEVTDGDTRSDAADLEKTEEAFPGLLETFDPAIPGMHRSATVDLIYVMEGRCELELDDGVRVKLAAGDTFIESGTMHAWRNPYGVQCKIIAAIIGAELAKDA